MRQEQHKHSHIIADYPQTRSEYWPGYRVTRQLLLDSQQRRWIQMIPPLRTGKDLTILTNSRLAILTTLWPLLHCASSLIRSMGAQPVATFIELRMSTELRT